MSSRSIRQLLSSSRLSLRPWRRCCRPRRLPAARPPSTIPLKCSPMARSSWASARSFPTGTMSACINWTWLTCSPLPKSTPGTRCGTQHARPAAGGAQPRGVAAASSPQAVTACLWPLRPCKSECSLRQTQRILQAWAAPGSRCGTQHARPAAGGTQPRGGAAAGSLRLRRSCG